ncbi:MAG: EFR1 family ferrodoxin [Muricomes sp.]
MNTQIFYFSGTGNSLFAAQKLSKHLPNSEIVPMVGAYEKGMKEIHAETVGFIFPVHAFSLPRLVERFIESLSFKPGTYIFALATRGGSSCRVFEEINKILSQKGLLLHCSSFVEMPNNYLTLFGIPGADDITRLTGQAQSQIEQIAPIIMRRETYHPKDPHYSFIEKNILFPLLAGVHKKTKFFNYGNRFYADTKCNGCSLCSRVCLAGRIAMNHGKPAWDRKVECQYCLACIQYCPCQAVQIKRTKTPGLGRYNHPEITAADIIAEKY